MPDNLVNAGGGVGSDDTVIANLGKHNKRERVLTDSVFQAKLRNVMKDNAYDRRVKGRKRGRLDMRSLYKIPAKVENIFTLKEARKNKHYNVILIVDQSGSMYGVSRGKQNDSAVKRATNKYFGGHYDRKKYYEELGDLDVRLIDVAANCASFLARSLDKVDINYAVIGFSGDWRYHKKFSQTASEDFLKKMKYDIKHTGGGGTNLYYPVKGAFQELRKTPEYQNIIINITDGQPDSPESVRRYVQGNRHVAEFVDIGIGYKPVMSNGIRIETIEDLKPLLIKELRKRIRRG